MDAGVVEPPGDAAGENEAGVRMRATKGYVAGAGTTGALIGAIGCAFAVLSAVVAVHGWPLELNGPGTSTVDERGVDGAVPLPGLFSVSADGRRGAHSGAGTRGRARRDRVVPAGAGPVASAFGPAADVRAPRSSGSADGPAPSAEVAGLAAGADPSPPPDSGAGAGADSGR
ncbi:MAG TPA: hypothetical protein VF250_04880, partial [Conexibacter sp.]